MANLTPAALSLCPEGAPRSGFVDRVAFAGLLVSIAILPLLYDRAARDPFTTPKRAAISVAMTGLVTLLFLGNLRSGIAANRVLICLIGIFAAGVVSSVLAASPVLAIESLRDLAFIGIPAALLGASLLRTPRRVLMCSDALGVAAFVIAVVGILQHQNLDWWGHRSASDLSSSSPARAFLTRVGLTRLFARLPTQDGPASVFGHPNVAAEIVAAGMVALSVAMFAALARASTNRSLASAMVALAVRLVAVLTMAFYLVVTGTRGAWVALAAAAMVLSASFVLQGPRGWRLWRLLIAVGLALLLGGAVYVAGSRISVAGRGGGAAETPLDRIKSLFKPADPARDTILERKVLWANTHGMLVPSKDPGAMTSLLGVGPGNWQVRYPLHHRDEAVHPAGTYTLHRYPDHPHQDALEFLAEYGLVGTALMAVFIAMAIAKLVASTRGRTGEARHAALALLGTLVVILSVSLFSFPLHLAPPLAILFLVCGAALALPGTGGGVLRIALAVLIFVGVAALGRMGPLDAPVAIIAALVVAMAALPLDRIVVCNPRTSRALAILSGGMLVVATLGAWSRVDASEQLQAAGGHAFGARFVPGDREGATARARDAYDRATAGNPADFLAELSRCDFLGQAGLLGDSEASARRVLRIHPWLINARVELACLRLKVEDDEAAMREARVARGLNPDAVEPRIVLGELFIRQGRSDLAVAEFERAIELSPKRFQPFGKIRAAEIYAADHRELPKTLRYLEEAASEAAENPEMLASIASLYSAGGAPPSSWPRPRPSGSGSWR